ncbi:hypothetical protein ABPG77_002884 [Micractinium sp. CCAP 211/92]
MQAMQGHNFGTSISPAGSLPIPAHWGAGSTGLSGAGSCEPAAPPPFAATWPLPEHGQPVMPLPMQPPLHWDAQQAGELQAAVAMQPWNSSWPVQPLHADQAYVPGAASGGMDMPPPVYGPYPYFPGDQYLPPPPPYLLQHQVCPGTWTAHQQPYALQQPAFAISPPAPAQAAGQGRLVARRKKAALPAEPSFGCDSGNLEGGNGAVLLLSAEASQAPEEIAAAAAASTEMQLVAATQHSRAASLAAADAAASAEGSAEPAAQPAQPSIAFDKAPRAVEWRPYSLADYRQKRYDAKQAAATYWALGGLGPGQPPSEQAGKRERQKQFGQAVSKANRERIATQPAHQPASPQRPGADVRQRALQFAKHSVPKPRSFKGRSTGGSLGCSTSGTAGTTTAAAEQEAAAGGMLQARRAADEETSTEPGSDAGAAELLAGELHAMTLSEAVPGRGASDQETAAAGGQA